MTTPPSARTSPGISILYLRKACAHATSSDPPSRNAPHTVVRVIPRASYDWGGHTSTHAPAPIPAIQPSTIATLYTRNDGTGYGELSIGQPTNQSAYHVVGPSLPSTVRPARFCTSRTFALVPAPKRPSASIPARFCHTFRPCAPDDLPEPKTSPGTSELGILPVTLVCLASSP